MTLEGGSLQGLNYHSFCRINKGPVSEGVQATLPLKQCWPILLPGRGDLKDGRAPVIHETEEVGSPLGYVKLER